MPNTIENIPNASILALEIESDILSGKFDVTLNRYRETKKSDVTLLINFDCWCKFVRNVDNTQVTYYNYTKGLLKKWIGVSYTEFPKLLQQKNYSAASYNDRLSCMYEFFEWMVKHNHIKSNPFADVPRRKRPGKKMWIESRRTPISTVDLNRIIKAVRTDEFCNPNSAFKHSHYAPFLLFLFTTGVRNAEAIGLRVRSVYSDYVEISEVMARTMQGTHAAARIRKVTKTDEIRRIPLTIELSAILKSVTQGKAPDDLVFQSPKGNLIDDRMLQRRVLKPVLEKLKISPRDLYAARHSFGTRAIQQGMAPTDVAYLMGHASVETTFRNYVTPSVPAALPTM